MSTTLERDRLATLVMGGSEEEPTSRSHQAVPASSLSIRRGFCDPWSLQDSDRLDRQHVVLVIDLGAVVARTAADGVGRIVVGEQPVVSRSGRTARRGRLGRPVRRGRRRPW